MTDLISRADAIEAVQKVCETIDKPCTDCTFFYDGCLAEKQIKALPSAEANPTVVRCKTMIPYGDFREWAKRIREDNPNVIVIPFDAEVASADAVHKPDYSYEADMVRRLKELLSAKAEDRLYIKIYADDEPSVKAEKLYQICDGTQNREVAKWLKEYFPLAEAVQGEWIDIDNYYRLATCSHCRKVTMFEKWGEYTKPYNFCPNCGARMKGGAE